MFYQLHNHQAASQFRLTYDEARFDREFYGRDRKDKLLTIAWNQGETQDVTIDNVCYDFPSGSILCLMVNESFNFSAPKDIVAWQFNREFYCIVDHDKEVSCVGFLFYGAPQRMFIALDTKEQNKIDRLLQVFLDEFDTPDHIQAEMMRLLLKRLIIIVTRLAKLQYVVEEELTGEKLDIIRKYNLLVENHYRSRHQVKFYADKLNKSPKTLSNLFALYKHKSPLAVIQERILLEARRLLYYTDKPAKEIAAELGFDDANHFGKFFKKNIGHAPSDFRKLSLASHDAAAIA